MDNKKRIILFSGKGGVGKTTLSLATGIKAAGRGRRVIVISLDQAHSLRDSLDITDGELFASEPGKPIKISNNLFIQEIDVQTEIDRNWHRISNYLFSLFKTTGFEDVVAEELAVVPGMSEVIGLLYINRYYRGDEFDTIILDCPPTGESLQFIAMPDMLEWYMKKLFKLERNIAKIARPFVKKLTDLPLPEDDYFASIKDLFYQLEGIDDILFNPEITTARLVTNPEKMVLQETKRAFMYFSLFNLSIDAVYVNRILDESISDPFFKRWKEIQLLYRKQMEEFFYPVPVLDVPLLENEVLGLETLRGFSDRVYGDHESPDDVFFTKKVMEITGKRGHYTLRLFLPLIKKEDIYLYRNNQELIIRIGSFKKHVFLPDSLKKHDVISAKKEGEYLCIGFGDNNEKV